MKIRGWQVNPNEVEDVIRKVEGVLDCAVYQVNLRVKCCTLGK